MTHPDDEYILTDAQWLAVRPLFIDDEDDAAEDGRGS
ncbi:hypothetical protein K883_05119 [Mycobacterium sp. TKK-01-0059]|nr:hypothetical protein K883_05119 [Mycobacterium sp. TKK-01-0059]